MWLAGEQGRAPLRRDSLGRWPGIVLGSTDSIRGRAAMQLAIELEREDDGRWIAEVPALSGVLAYGQNRDQAVAKVQALALRVLAERLEHGEAAPELLSVSFQAA